MTMLTVIVHNTQCKIQHCLLGIFDTVIMEAAKHDKLAFVGGHSVA